MSNAPAANPLRGLTHSAVSKAFLLVSKANCAYESLTILIGKTTLGSLFCRSTTSLEPKYSNNFDLDTSLPSKKYLLPNSNWLMSVFLLIASIFSFSKALT